MIAEQAKTRTETATLPEAPERDVVVGRERGAVETLRAQNDGTVKNRPVRRTTIWGFRETAAVLIASFAVTLLCLYVAAYARVTAEGFDANRLAKRLRASQNVEKQLEAEISRLKLPETVQKRATEMGMVPMPPGSTQFLNADGSIGSPPAAPPPKGPTEAGSVR